MKTEIAVLSGKQPYGVRLELSVEEAETVVYALKGQSDEKCIKIAHPLNNLIDNVKNLNQGDFDSPPSKITNKKGKANNG